jgi:hypothetical protein
MTNPKPGTQLIFQASDRNSANPAAIPTDEADFLAQQTQSKMSAKGFKPRLSGTLSVNNTAKTIQSAPVATETPTETTSTEVNSEEPTGTASTAAGLSADQIAQLIQTAATAAAQQVQVAAQQQIEQVQQAAQQQVEEVQQQSEAEIQALQTELTAAQQQAARLADVFRLVGQAPASPEGNSESSNSDRRGGIPALITQFDSRREPEGAIKHAFELMADTKACPTKYWTDPNTGDVHTHRDYTVVQRFYREHKQEFRASLEIQMKREGYLRGGTTSDSHATAGATGPSTVPDNYLDVLSLMMRETHSPKYIWWQFPVTINRPGFGPESSIMIPRYNWLDEPTNEAAFLLADLDGTYNDINSSDQALVMTSVPAVVKEYGLGKGGATGTRPVAIPEFYSMYSITSLETALQTRLGHNFNGFEDMMVRNQYFKTTQVRYNNGGRVATSPSQVVTGSDGTLTDTFLRYLYAHATGELQIPTMDDGCLNFVTYPNGVAQLKDSLENKMEAPTPAQILELTNMLTAQGAPEMDVVSGYVGKIENCHIWQQNATSVGTPGSSGVQTETFGSGVGSQTSYSSWLFGRSPVGVGVGMPMQIRQDSSGKFGRMVRYIWLMHVGYVPIDVDPDSTNPANNQQLRVLEIRSLAESV